MSLTLAIIGLKGHQYIVLDALPSMPEVELVAVADDDPAATSRVQDLRRGDWSAGFQPASAPPGADIPLGRGLPLPLPPQAGPLPVWVGQELQSPQATCLLPCGSRALPATPAVPSASSPLRCVRQSA